MLDLKCCRLARQMAAMPSSVTHLTVELRHVSCTAQQTVCTFFVIRTVAKTAVVAARHVSLLPTDCADDACVGNYKYDITCTSERSFQVLLVWNKRTHPHIKKAFSNSWPFHHTQCTTTPTPTNAPPETTHPTEHADSDPAAFSINGVPPVSNSAIVSELCFNGSPRPPLP